MEVCGVSLALMVLVCGAHSLCISRLHHEMTVFSKLTIAPMLLVSYMLCPFRQAGFPNRWTRLAQVVRSSDIDAVLCGNPP